MFEAGSVFEAKSIFVAKNLFEAKSIFAGYNRGDVIRNISLTVQQGEILSILGPNGCGKSTLLKALARIINCRGSITLDGCDMAALPRREFAKKIAMMGQSVNIFFPYTVRECVSMGRYAHSKNFFKNLSAKDNEIIETIMKKLDIWDIRRSMIDELSGGQIQRIFLAMTLVQEPEIILLDEPTSHLDLKHQIDLLDFLKIWVKENNKTLISVFHDMNLALRFSDTALVLHNGTLAASGKIEDVMKSKTLNDVFGVDVCGFMQKSLEMWRGFFI
jgi:iron complex transport system ATP-binding protein